MNDQLSLEIDEGAKLQSIWSKVLQLVEAKIGREAVESWLRDTQPLGMENGAFTLNTPNATARTWIEKKYARALAVTLTEVLDTDTRLQVVSRPRGAKEAAKKRSERRPTPARPAPSAAFAPIPLNEKYTFDNYVVGQSNRFAYAAASAVADSPGRGYNPLFIYGGVGLGKTHLLQAIGHALKQREPNARVAYVSGETFTSHFITSLREHKEEEFRRTYRGVDIWLVDDIQFIADKTSTKEEFFHTFNELYLTNRQIVLASDRPPRELRLMEDRLRSRLESGLMVEIAEPDLETRVAILQKRAEMEGQDVPAEVLYHIAHSVTNNVRVLEAALIRMIALASLNRCPVTTDLAGRALSAFVQEGRMTSVTLTAIRTAVCKHFNVSEEDLVSPRRDRPTSMARQVAMYLMRELSRKSLVEIGSMFGGKSHSTVLYACDKLEKELRTDKALDAAVRTIRSKLASAPQQDG